MMSNYGLLTVSTGTDSGKIDILGEGKSTYLIS